MINLQDAMSSRYRVDPGCARCRRDNFERISLWVVRTAGGRDRFYFAFILILAWMATGPYFQFHDERLGSIVCDSPNTQ
jgi:Low affinity iron permease